VTRPAHDPHGRPFNVLISSAGRRVVLARLFRAALADLGLSGQVAASDASPLSAAWVEADTRIRVPRCTDPAFVPELLDACIANAIHLVIPTIDSELPVLAAVRDQFAAVGTTIAISGPHTVAIAQDKSRTHRWLVDAGLPTVAQWAVADAPDDPSAYPLIAKPRCGSSSVGVQVVPSPDVLAPLREQDFVVETIAPGREHTVDIYVDRSGALVTAVPRRRLETRGGEVSKGLTVRHDGLIELAGRVAASFEDAYGALNFQCFVDPATDRLTIIELNARFGGGFPLSDAAGAWVPRWIIEDLAGLPSSVGEGTFQDGLVMLRFDEAVFTTREALGPGVI
jgi:carbamoyl-phosphate synthase large subunit